MSRRRYFLKWLGFGVGTRFVAIFCMVLNIGNSDLVFRCAKHPTDMPWSTADRIVQNAARLLVAPAFGKSLNNFILKIEGLSLVDAIFALRDSLRPV